MNEQVLQGTPAAPGIAIGEALVYLTPAQRYHGFRPVGSESRYCAMGTSGAQVAQLDEAIAAADARLAATADEFRMQGKQAEAHIFDAHRALLTKPSLRERALTLIMRANWRAAEAIIEAGEQQAAPLADTGDPYLLAYAADIRDVVRQVHNILENERTLADRLESPAIVVADDLGLSEWMNVPRERLLGLALAHGGTTGHSMIMARSLGIPTIIGLDLNQLRTLRDGHMLALDGSSGELIVSPDAETLVSKQTAADALTARIAHLRSQCHLPACTTDGKRVTLLVNAATVAEAQTAREWGAEGVGSLRTELLFLGQMTLPDEDQQLALYNAIANELPGMPIVARTLDVGGDKHLPSFPLPRESNPFLGWRGIRIGLSHPETILLPQLRAMLRAGAHADLRIVLPMVATVEELRDVRALLNRAHRDLQAEGVPCAAVPRLGVMVEIPSAAINADALARESDFLSIGTNDLIQYTLACDRTNVRVADIYQALDPAVLRLLHLTIEAAHRHHLRVSICGEIASDPRLTPLLIGMRVDELSCTPTALPYVREAVRATSAARSRELAAIVLTATCREEIQRLVACR